MAEAYNHHPMNPPTHLPTPPHKLEDSVTKVALPLKTTRLTLVGSFFSYKLKISLKEYNPFKLSHARVLCAYDAADTHA